MTFVTAFRIATTKPFAEGETGRKQRGYFISLSLSESVLKKFEFTSLRDPRRPPRASGIEGFEPLIVLTLQVAARRARAATATTTTKPQPKTTKRATTTTTTTQRQPRQPQPQPKQPEPEPQNNHNHNNHNNQHQNNSQKKQKTNLEKSRFGGTFDL